MCDTAPHPSVIEVDLLVVVTSCETILTANGLSRTEDPSYDLILCPFNMSCSLCLTNVPDSKGLILGSGDEDILVSWVVERQRGDARRVRLVFSDTPSIGIFCVIQSDDVVTPSRNHPSARLVELDCICCTLLALTSPINRVYYQIIVVV